MSRLRVYEKGADIETLDLRIEDWQPPHPGAGQVLVQVKATGVNPSDVKATLGAMAHAVWPRTPGRDWAGVVSEGPQRPARPRSLRAPAATWASPATAPTPAIWCCPRRTGVPRPRLTLAEAGALGVPFVTAHEGLRRAGLPRAATWCW